MENINNARNNEFAKEINEIVEEENLSTVPYEGAKRTISTFELLQSLQNGLSELRQQLDIKNVQSNVPDALQRLNALRNDVKGIPCKYEALSVSLDAVRSMLGHVLNYNGTRIALCATIDRAMPYLTEAIEAEEVHEEAQAMRRVITSFYKLNDEELSRLFRLVKNS